MYALFLPVFILFKTMSLVSRDNQFEEIIITYLLCTGNPNNVTTKVGYKSIKMKHWPHTFKIKYIYILIGCNKTLSKHQLIIITNAYIKLVMHSMLLIRQVFLSNIPITSYHVNIHKKV